jgi:hypothetical protein
MTIKWIEYVVDDVDTEWADIYKPRHEKIRTIENKIIYHMLYKDNSSIYILNRSRFNTNDKPLLEFLIK